MNRRRGYTVVEMVVVLAMTAVILAAAFGALANSYGYDERARASRESGANVRRTEDRLRDWLRRAALSSVNTDTASYMIGGQAGTESDLTFTAAGERLASSYTASNLDFETANERFGPEGGMAEVSLSLTGIGDGASRTGLFLRVQRPADGDPSQGGMQELLDPDVETLSWEFYDGQAWQSQWNTQALGDPRLPSAIRLTYRRRGEDSDRILTVAVPSSDATATNPVLTGGDV